MTVFFGLFFKTCLQQLYYVELSTDSQTEAFLRFNNSCLDPMSVFLFLFFFATVKSHIYDKKAKK